MEITAKNNYKFKEYDTIHSPQGWATIISFDDKNIAIDYGSSIEDIKMADFLIALENKEFEIKSSSPEKANKTQKIVNDIVEKFDVAITNYEEALATVQLIETQLKEVFKSQENLTYLRELKESNNLIGSKKETIKQLSKHYLK